MTSSEIDAALFVQRHERQHILPPQAGVPEPLRPFFDSERIEEPVVRRRDYLLDSWSSINLARANRPFSMPRTGSPAPTGDCPFCPGQESLTPGDERTGEDTLRWGDGERWTLRVFPNLYPWLMHHVDVVETPEHKTHVSELTPGEWAGALQALAELCRQYHAQGIWPVVFKNHGFGSSIQHVHWQAGALPRMPRRVAQERAAAVAFKERFGRSAYAAIVDREREKGERFVAMIDGLAVFTPFAPRTNFESWLVASDNVSSLAECSQDQLEQFGAALDRVLKTIDQCIHLESLGIVCHQTEPGDPAYRLHFEIIPYKHYGGAERGFEEYALEVAPEQAAQQLRDAMGATG